MTKGRRPRPSEAAETFMDLVARWRFDQGPYPKPRLLTNLTFWAGAGFSKSWDVSTPTGAELFSISHNELNRTTDPYALARLRGVEDDNDLTPDALRQIVYQLDMYERYPDVRSRYIDPQNISMLRAALRAAVLQRYTEISKLNYLDTGSGKFLIDSTTKTQNKILLFFDHLRQCLDGSTGFTEGIQCHFITTNYDYVIETILDNITDSLFLYTYRGFTPLSISRCGNPVITHHHWLAAHLIKLNGGFEILRDGDQYNLDYSERTPAEVVENPPIIMLPSREQDYTDPYFRLIFPKVVRLIRDTKILVLVGYSLPDDDALIRFILRQFAEEPEDARSKTIFYVDPMPGHEKRDRLEAVFPSLRDRILEEVPQVVTYEGTFDAFVAECLAIISVEP
jgi:hypothetical protein